MLALVFASFPLPALALPKDDQDALTYDGPRFDPNVYGLGGACSTGGGTGGPNGTVPANWTLGQPANSENAAKRQVNLMKAMMADYGFTPRQAAGVIGNFVVESGGAYLPPDVNEGGRHGPPAFRGGYGWAQWTGSRQRTFIDYAVKKKYMASRNVNATDAADYAYLKHELNTGYKETVRDLKIQTTIEGAVVSWERTFEKAGVPAIGARGTAARKAYENYQKLAGTTEPTNNEDTDPATTDCTQAGIVGDVAFPLLGSKKVVKNPSMFKNGTASRGGHPYIAFDILANTGTPVIAFMSGVVTRMSHDKCGGRLIGVYNKESGIVISYLHTAPEPGIKEGAQIKLAQQIATVGNKTIGCGTPHLHIDGFRGKMRAACKREGCSPENAAKFVDIGPQLYKTFQELPDN